MRGALKRLAVVERLRAALRQDVEQTLKPLRKEVRRLSKFESFERNDPNE